MIKLERFRNLVLLLSGLSPAGVMKRSDNAGGDELLFICHVLDGIHKDALHYCSAARAHAGASYFMNAAFRHIGPAACALYVVIKQEHIFAYFK